LKGAIFLWAILFFAQYGLSQSLDLSTVDNWSDPVKLLRYIDYEGAELPGAGSTVQDTFTVRLTNSDPGDFEFLLSIPDGWKLILCSEVEPLNFLKGNRTRSFYFFELPESDTICLTIFPSDIHVENLNLLYYRNTKSFDLLPFVFSKGDVVYLVFALGLIAILFFLTIMNLPGYFISGRKDYLFYSLYTGILCVYFLYRLYRMYLFNNGLPAITSGSLFNMAIQPWFYVAYSLFAREFLDTGLRFRTLHRFLLYFIWLSIISSLGILFFYEEVLSISKFIFDAYRVVALVIGSGLIFYLYYKKDKLGRFMVLGTLSLVTGASIAMIMTWLQKDLWGLYALAYLKLGIVLEFLFFGLGLAQKTAIITDEKLELQRKLNAETEQLRDLQQNLNTVLQEKLNAAKLDLAREQQLKIEKAIELKSVEFELEMLLNQMNPHFLFNSLNSLKLFVLKQDQEAAIKYMDRLTQLVRNFLQFSRRKTITIQEALDNMKLYVAIENDRLKNPIILEINIADNVDPEYQEIPPFILQPFVENSIWHGLSHTQITDPTIRIEIRNINDFTRIIINDNGRGRKKDERIESSNDNMGIATSITSRRIQLYNQGVEGLRVEDLTDVDGNPAGTAVIISLLRLD
jgi:sensor histidine kinase YesM